MDEYLLEAYVFPAHRVHLEWLIRDTRAEGRFGFDQYILILLMILGKGIDHHHHLVHLLVHVHVKLNDGALIPKQAVLLLYLLVQFLVGPHHLRLFVFLYHDGAQFGLQFLVALLPQAVQDRQVYLEFE